MAVKKRRNRKRKMNSKFSIQDFFVKNGQLKRRNTVLFIIGVLLLCVMALHWQNQRQEATNTVTAPSSIYQQRVKWLNSLAPYAQQLQRQYGVLASITLAQAAHESNWNNSQLSQKYYNFYGIKAAPGQKSILLPTSEFVKGQWVTVRAPFKVYDNVQGSMLDHAQLLVRGTSENHQRYNQVIHATNYVAAANALYQAGYATDPEYAQKLIKIIEMYHLNRFDR
ncbi:glycoside hydrolase family 73 protein [Periweissella fabalis]|uniref:Glycoside hydrolase family 73 protein n=1 Tax=Periweissella fabalis TaxID=1070421 RepID=A0A7X6N3S2_9LACO|nr:glycoside hydrolase family 73 protein [Periweissella fabalis]MCM0598261.1 glycoside hydrolase family 73 protein [Periweissella fabalis]NKZ24804.1 glycoside hydrolase family 73 protein [Periweissella fabalis]